MNNKAMTPLDELNLTDGFLFAETMDESDAYRQDFSQEFLDFMEYINDTRDAVAARSSSARVQLIHSRVEKIRRSEK